MAALAAGAGGGGRDEQAPAALPAWHNPSMHLGAEGQALS